MNPEAHEEIRKTFKTIATFIIEGDYILGTPLSKINLIDSSRWLHFGNFNLGETVKKEIKKREDDGIKEFMKNSFRFILAILIEFQNRFNLSDEL